MKIPQKKSQKKSNVTPTRFFSTIQANKTVGFVEKIVADITFQFTDLLKWQASLEQSDKDRDDDAYSNNRQQVISSFGKLLQYQSDLKHLGVELADWRKGIVHFPYIHENREAQLCWKPGEKQVEHFHEVGQCLTGRKTISNLEKHGRYISEKTPAKKITTKKTKQHSKP